MLMLGQTPDGGADAVQLDSEGKLICAADVSGVAIYSQVYKSLDLDETEEEIKATAGYLCGFFFNNAAAAVRYLKFYNATAANVAVGTTVPVATFPLPALSAGVVPFPRDLEFSTAITAAVTTGLADNDTGAPAANDVQLMAFYR